ncbi:hypothetical protein VFPPC_16093 [Pochonia chlamydosporia 170]|uniref:Uncharacterized protein n=1 Tax=Pochonia chlamydosporia 170 TaxID=1380566 RepID=A0A179FP21_METCM|nr:hypothetical protein VFPPC_16093 [Pochonia chlamydosporia 170]OAQ66980.1 hypothetical protein VFPPC_16093 [Pochonia chlamydosporia 170]
MSTFGVGNISTLSYIAIFIRAIVWLSMCFGIVFCARALIPQQCGKLTSTKLQDANEYHILQGWDHTRLVSYNKSSNYREPGKKMQLLRF